MRLTLSFIIFILLMFSSPIFAQIDPDGTKDADPLPEYPASQAAPEQKVQRFELNDDLVSNYKASVEKCFSNQYRKDFAIAYLNQMQEANISQCTARRYLTEKSPAIFVLGLIQNELISGSLNACSDLRRDFKHIRRQIEEISKTEGFETNSCNKTVKTCNVYVNSSLRFRRMPHIDAFPDYDQALESKIDSLRDNAEVVVSFTYRNWSLVSAETSDGKRLSGWVHHQELIDCR